MIEVSEAERAIIDTPTFQRLRRIRQLALTNHVYPGAEHTRFGHSLGAMHLAGRIFDAVREEKRLNGADIQDWEDRRKLVRLAALVHDIGHAPFSHAAEDVLFPKGRKHEQIGADIVQSDRLAPLITRHYGEAAVQQVAAILDPRRTTEASWLDSIVSGPLDADKLDYLLRDSHFCGVTYGQYDAVRLLSKLVLRTAPSPEDPDETVEQVVVTVGGLQAAESVFVARYWMFVQVYYHSVRRQLDHLLGLFVNHEVVNGMYPVDDLEQYLAWDDVKVLSALASGDGPWARRLKAQRPYYAQIAEREPGRGSDAKAKWFGKVAADLCNELGEEAAFYDDPFINTSAVHPGLGSVELMVEWSEGRFAPVREVSDFVQALVGKENRRYEPRLFALPEHKERAQAKYDEFAAFMEEKG